MSTLEEAERRLRHGVPLRLDQVTDLLQEGVDVHALEDNFDDDDSRYVTSTIQTQEERIHE